MLEEVALAPREELEIARLGLRLAPADLADFRSRLLDLLDEVSKLPDDPSAPAMSLFSALHPDPNRP